MNAVTTTEASALAARPQRQFDLSPQNFEQALTFSEYLASSDMVPKAFRGKPGDCLIAMQWGYEVNLKPLQALQSIAVINGKPGLYGDAGKAILLSSGCAIEEDDMDVIRQAGIARCRISRPGRPPVERSFSVEDAKTAGLWGKDGPWRTYPFRQMAWRAFWFAARDSASDLLRGLSGIEELGDYLPTESKSMGAAEVVQPAHEALPQPYGDAEFDEKLPAWRGLITEGKKTADQIIATVETRRPLTEEQKQHIRNGRTTTAEVIDNQAE